MAMRILWLNAATLVFAGARSSITSRAGARVQVLWWVVMVAARASWPTTILMISPYRVVIGGSIGVATSVTLGASHHLWRLRRSSLALICGELFKISNARLEAFHALAFANITGGTLMVRRIDATVTSSTAGLTCRRVPEVLMRAMSLPTSGRS